MAIKTHTLPPLDWKAIRERAMLCVRCNGLDPSMLDGIGPGEDGETKLIEFARRTGQSLDLLVKGDRSQWSALNRADETINDLRALVWAVDRLTYDPSPCEKERAKDEHSIRMLVVTAWNLLEAHDKAGAEI